jgi:hypothetical protein
MRLAATALVIAIVSLLATAGAESKLSYRVVPVGTEFSVGTPLACAVGKAKSDVVLSCADRNPKNGRIYRPSIGALIRAGKSAKVAIVLYTKNGVAGVAAWQRNQPRYRPTALFPKGKVTNDFTAKVGDRLAVGGTDILCAMARGPRLFCLVWNTKTVYPVPGTFGLALSGKDVEVGRVNAKYGFDAVNGYNEPKLEG